MQLSTTQTQQRIDAIFRCRYRVADHREEWARILPGLEALHAQDPQQDWDIDGIRAQLDEEMAFLLIDEDMPGAFVVARFDEYPYIRGEKELYIYLLWHEGRDVIDRFQPHLEVFAARNGAKYMRFYSQRPAFLRVAQREGYKVRGVEYVKELHHGQE